MNRVPCAECGKSFLNLRQHQTKIHKRNTIIVSIPPDFNSQHPDKPVFVNIRGDTEEKELELLDYTENNGNRTLTYEDTWTGYSFRITLRMEDRRIIDYKLYRIHEFKEGDVIWRPIFDKMYQLNFTE